MDLRPSIYTLRLTAVQISQQSVSFWCINCAETERFNAIDEQSITLHWCYVNHCRSSAHVWKPGSSGNHRPIQTLSSDGAYYCLTVSLLSRSTVCDFYSTVALVLPISIIAYRVRGITCRNFVTARVESCVNNGHNSCDSGISVLNYCHSWDKFVNTHLSHSRQ